MLTIMSYTNNPMIYMQRSDTFLRKKKKKCEPSIIKIDPLVQIIRERWCKEIYFAWFSKIIIAKLNFIEFIQIILRYHQQKVKQFNISIISIAFTW